MINNRITTSKVRGFTLIELIAVIAILGVLAAIAIPRFYDLTDAAHQANVDATVGALRTGSQQYQNHWRVNGSPAGNNVVLNVDGIPVRFRNGIVDNVTNRNHVPAGTPNRGAAATRLFFLFLSAPPNVVGRNSDETGWAMLGNNQCSGGGRRRCWGYRVGGSRFARVTYFVNNGGSVVVD